MPEKRPIPGSAKDWLARAESDLALARMPLPEESYYEDLCFHAQQAAENKSKNNENQWITLLFVLVLGGSPLMIAPRPSNKIRNASSSQPYRRPYLT